MTNLSHIRRTFVRQHHQSWCGLACLASIIRYFGGDTPQEKLQAQSGTTLTGTTLLGLYQAANAAGLKAEGYEADVETLKEINSPAVLHLSFDDGLQHYVVCYGYSGGGFVIGDPAKGVDTMSETELESLWKSKSLLLVEKGEKFSNVSDATKRKIAWLKSLLKPDLPVLATVTVLSMAIATAGIALAVFSQKLIDKILPAKDTGKLWTGLVVLATLLAAKSGLSYLRTLLVVRQSRDFANRIVGGFYGLILYLPKSFYDGLKTGEITARLNDASRIQRTVNYVSGTLLIDILMVIACTALLFNYMTITGIIAIAAGATFALIFWKYGRKIVSGQRKVMVSYAAAESNFFDTVQGADVIKSNKREEFFTNYTKRIYSDFQSSVYDLGLLGNRVGIKIDLTGVAAIIAMIAVGSHAVLTDSLSLGAMVAVLSLASSAVSSSASLSGAYLTLQEAKVAYDRLYEFASMDREDAEDLAVEAKPTVQNISVLELQGVGFRFPGRPLLLNDLSFTVRKGELTAVLGEIGSGKSTLLQILQRFYEPESGKIYADGVEWKSFSTGDWRGLTGAMPQNVKLFNATLIENICLSNDEEDIKRCLAFCFETGAASHFNALPMGAFTRVGEDGVNLSGGQRQLVGLCRALYKNPPILLLDEPGNNMDKATLGFLRDLLEREKHRRICILVTHDESLVKIADRSFRLQSQL